MNMCLLSKLCWLLILPCEWCPSLFVNTLGISGHSHMNHFSWLPLALLLQLLSTACVLCLAPTTSWYLLPTPSLHEEAQSPEVFRLSAERLRSGLSSDIQGKVLIGAVQRLSMAQTWTQGQYNQVGNRATDLSWGRDTLHWGLSVPLTDHIRLSGDLSDSVSTPFTNLMKHDWVTSWGHTSPS